jgi:FtsP/CotA-like multicopper oxidase with cupredoxin domain
VPASSPQQALLMTLAERADVIVDFSSLKDGTVVTMINTAPDAPFGGFPDDPADHDTTGQVMQFVVNKKLLLPSDSLATNPYRLQPVAEGDLGAASQTREVSLNEGESEEVCVEEDEEGNVVQILGSVPPDCEGGGEPFAPKEALLGVLDGNGDPVPLKWTDTTGVSQPAAVTMANGDTVWVNVTENPTVGDTEEWEIYNFTEDAHPIHLHLVRFEVVGRSGLHGGPSIVGNAPQPWETGYKDTVIAYPDEITTVKARFDLEGLYVWHCHIVEHEDNEMMRPYVVSPD